jgi:hypothetical protein
MYYIIQNTSGVIIESNIDNTQIKESLLSCKVKFERVECNIKKQYRRQCFFQLGNFNYFLCSYDQNITNRIFKFYQHAFSILSKIIEDVNNTIQSVEKQKTRRLKHNIVTHNTNILQEIYQLIPQESFKNQKNHLVVIENLLRGDMRKTALMCLKILKFSNLMKTEFIVNDMLENDNPYLDFGVHPIHKVLLLTLNPFWIEIVEKSVYIEMDSCVDFVQIDYNSISVALSHIFDNTAKYIMPHSTLNIHFLNLNTKVSIHIEMHSLKVEDEDKLSLFEEGYSGVWAKKLELDGNGIGMHVVEKLIALNNGTIKFETNIDKNKNMSFDGVPYERNRFVIELNKTV